MSDGQDIGAIPARLIAICEAFLGQVLIEREIKEELEASATWQRLKHHPVTAINKFNFQDVVTDIDSSGNGWVRMPRALSDPLRVTYRAGMATDLDGLPEPIKQGLTRLQQHVDTMGDAAEPPAAVTALWRPYRIARLA